MIKIKNQHSILWDIVSIKSKIKIFIELNRNLDNEANFKNQTYLFKNLQYKT
jgi:hypothetical protein